MKIPRRVLALFALFTLAANAAESRPNILFLLSDDHSYPFLSCYGDTNVKTPTLDQLASDGMKFHRFFTTAPQCVPSRASFLTGRSPVAARITRFSSPLARDEVNRAASRKQFPISTSTTPPSARSAQAACSTCTTARSPARWRGSVRSTST